MEDPVWSVERRLWIGDAGAYSELMAEDCIMVLPGSGTLQGEAIIGAVGDQPRWNDVVLHDQFLLQPAPTIKILVYRAEARRDAQEPYLAWCSSTYAQTAGLWQIVQHQQTPV